MSRYFRAMRVHHYIKNFLILVPLVCSGQFFTAGKFIPCLLGFFSFCFLTSAIYIVNDIHDLEEDRHHPTKCHRPIASGSISVAAAKRLFFLLLAAAVVLDVFATRNWRAHALFFLYFILNVGYSFGLKQIPLLDIAILASGYLLRVLYGADVSGIQVSSWLYLTVITAAMFFALGKRRNELARMQQTQPTRKVLLSYSVDFLDKNMYLCLALTNTFYALWSMDAATTELYGKHSLVWTVPIILLIFMRYNMDIDGDTDGDPVEVLLHDKFLILLSSCYLLAMALILYVF